ncbi:hypothetical protein BLNAU_5659 [Blattamonas nauphoetae]|uniref:Uncharacterized protein n=1 Tax=Blattamonas nauphoetae TaxID=2049346 RepID=A0ABQ9Y6G5_9EUKA|nr:hypothetical protein BLNAU_5659 [Blattamonas nauphoetae]
MTQAPAKDLFQMSWWPELDEADLDAIENDRMFGEEAKKREKPLTTYLTIMDTEQKDLGPKVLKIVHDALETLEKKEDTLKSEMELD